MSFLSVSMNNYGFPNHHFFYSQQCWFVLTLKQLYSYRIKKFQFLKLKFDEILLGDFWEILKINDGLAVWNFLPALKKFPPAEFSREHLTLKLLPPHPYIRFRKCDICPVNRPIIIQWIIISSIHIELSINHYGKAPTVNLKD